MSYKTRRYKEGLSGNKPGWFVLDEEGHRAQETGYRDFLRNQDLADRIHQGGQDNNYGSGGGSWDYYSSPSKPMDPGQRKAIGILLSLLAAVLLRWAFLMARYFENAFRPMNGRTAFDWIEFFMILFIFPASVLFWPGIAFLVWGIREITSKTNSS